MMSYCAILLTSLYIISLNVILQSVFMLVKDQIAKSKYLKYCRISMIYCINHDPNIIYLCMKQSRKYDLRLKIFVVYEK